MQEDEVTDVQFNRIFVPDLSAEDMLDDAFRAIARDGAGVVEAQIRLQKALCAIAELPNEQLADAATRMSTNAFERAEEALGVDADVELVRDAARWAEQTQPD